MRALMGSLVGKFSLVSGLVLVSLQGGDAVRVARDLVER